MPEAPWISLVDDGELEDVRAVLTDLGAEFVHWTKGAVPISGREPTRLLVITSPLAASLDYRRSPGRSNRAVWIAVTDTDSRSQRRLILESGFDYLIRRPVHPTALRMLLERSIWSGDEQRQRNRVAVGYEISYRVGLRSRPAVLVDLSPGGCRLLSKHKVDLGYRVTVHFPSEIAGTAAFTHPGVVVRVEKGEMVGGESNEVSLGVRFAKFPPETRDKMRAVLNHLCTGPPKLPAPIDAPTSPTTPTSPTSPSIPSSPTLRRLAELSSPGASGGEFVRDWATKREPRAAYQEEVGIFGMEGCVLNGRDLSKSGLRVDAHPALCEGAEIRLALPAKSGDPIVVGATVVRDDGERGVALRFSWVEFGAEERLEELLQDLPSIDSLTPEQAEENGVVLTKLLPTLLRRKKH